MEPETIGNREQREAELKRLCEGMGLVVAGSIVVAPLARPVAVDASAADHGNLVAGLMYLAYRQGVVHGRSEIRDDINRILGGSPMTEGGD